MKHIIIGGTCRTGKTLLSTALKKYLPQLNYLSVDYIRNALTEVYKKDYRHEYLNELQNFLYSLYYNYKKRASGGHVILEGCYITMEEVLKRYNSPDNIIIFVGRPQLSPQQSFNEIRECEKLVHSWTEECDDKEIMDMTEKEILIDRKNQKLCKENGFYFLDTSYDRFKVIDDFANKIAQELLEGSNYTHN